MTANADARKMFGQKLNVNFTTGKWKILHVYLMGSATCQVRRASVLVKYTTCGLHTETVKTDCAVQLLLNSTTAIVRT